MHLVSYVSAGRPSWGALREGKIFDVGARIGADVFDLRSALELERLEHIERLLSSAPILQGSAVEYLPVIPNPRKILCVGLNYQSHRQETGRAEVAHPTIFTRFADTQVGHDQSLVRPRVSTQFDFEGELAVVIGRGGRYISRERAMEHVAGYACYMDATVRDWQQHTHQFTPGKNFPGTGGFGPALVTREAIADVTALELATRVNGVIVQQAHVDQMIFPIPVLIEYCSAFTPLAAGDVIATGTPGGVGAKRNPPLFLKSGDVVEVEITGLGTLRNTVRDEALAD